MEKNTKYLAHWIGWNYLRVDPRSPTKQWKEEIHKNVPVVELPIVKFFDFWQLYQLQRNAESQMVGISKNISHAQ